MLRIVILFFFHSLNVYAGDEVCTNTGQLSPPVGNTEMWVGLSKELAIEAASKDLKGFCEWNRMDRFTGSFKYLPDGQERLQNYRESKVKGDRDGSAEALSGTTKADEPWLASMLGNAKLKTDPGHKEATYFKEVCTGLPPMACAEKMTENLGRTDFSGNSSLPEFKKARMPEAASLEVIGACGFLDPLGVIACNSNSRKLLSLVEIHSSSDGAETTVVPLIKDSLSDTKITKSLQRVSANLWKQIADNKFQKKDNIFTDLVRELKKDGFSNKEAKQKAVQVLGAIGTGGPNFARRIGKGGIEKFPSSCQAPASCNLNGVFMAALAEGMVHADTLKMSQKDPSPYSLPAGANFPCDSGKSYHFWTSAALAQRLVSEGGPRSAAKAAVYASHMGYHLRPALDRASNVLTVPRYGATENGLRMDMNLAAAGASFGARLDSIEGSEDLKMKEGFLQTLKSGNLSSVDKKAKFTRGVGDVYEWTQRTSARTAFGYYP